MSVLIKSQREALVKIMTGQEADEGTLWIEEGHFGTVRLDGLGHWWMLQDPARAATVLREFWATLA